MTFQVKYFNNALKIIEGFLSEGYEVTSKQVMKPWPNDKTMDYYSIEINKENTDREGIKE